MGFIFGIEDNSFLCCYYYTLIIRKIQQYFLPLDPGGLMLAIGPGFSHPLVNWSNC
jgi:hypothetical protein